MMKYTRPDGAVLVPTGSDLSHADCRRAEMFLQGHRVPIVGVVENLSRRSVSRISPVTDKFMLGPPSRMPKSSRPAAGEGQFRGEVLGIDGEIRWLRRLGGPLICNGLTDWTAHSTRLRQA